MGTFTAITQAKRLMRRLGADIYAHAPSFLEALRGKVVILMYHRVVGEGELSRQYIQPGMYVTTETFERHVAFLQQYFEIVSFGELLAMWDEQRWDPDKRYCLITFDDGWLDNYTCAFPVLKRRGAPATVFLPTAFIGTERWFWPEKVAWICRHVREKARGRSVESSHMLLKRDSRATHLNRALIQGDIDGLIDQCKEYGPEQREDLISGWLNAFNLECPVERQTINWDEAREMSDAGISFGSHSISHAILTEVESNKVVEEVQESWAVLARQGINVVPVFAYPNGNWSPDIARMVADAGYQAAATTEFGYEGRFPDRRFALRRINIHEAISHTEPLFAFHMAGYNNITWR
jgi:peptidoglycan/xylan/chitin deacetylase (PgdA/CDA1 family)